MINFNINLSKIDKTKIFVGEKGMYLNVTVVEKNEPGRYGETHTMYITPTKEEIEARKQGDPTKKIYLGNGKKIQPQAPRPFNPNTDDGLPF